MLSLFQNYWWLLISILAAAFVALTFVQGGQSLLQSLRMGEERTLAINALGRKWELTFTTLVVFGGAFFAAFPLFYATSFGGAHALWLFILFSYIIQAFSYEFRRKKGNLYGTDFYDCLLMLNGALGIILPGIAVGSMIFGNSFTIKLANLTLPNSPEIVIWGTQWGGLEAIANWRCVALGLALFFLSRMTAAMYLMNTVEGPADMFQRLRRRAQTSGFIFVPLFLIFLAAMLMSPAYVTAPGGEIELRAFGYLANFASMWWASLTFLIGTIAVLGALMGIVVNKQFKGGFRLSFFGTMLVVASLFWIIGYGGTAYYPSVSDMQSSLTLANSSSSLFTLQVMSVVSIILPFVIAYIVYVWRRMGRTPISLQSLLNENNY